MKNKGLLVVIILLLVVFPIITCLFVGTVVYTFFIPFFSPNSGGVTVTTSVPSEVTAPSSSTQSSQSSFDEEWHPGIGKAYITIQDINSDHFTVCSLDKLYKEDGTSQPPKDASKSSLFYQGNLEMQEDATNRLLKTGNRFDNYLSVINYAEIEYSKFDIPETYYNKDMLLVWNQECKYTLNGTKGIDALVFPDYAAKKIYFIQKKNLNVPEDPETTAITPLKLSSTIKEYDIVKRAFVKEYPVSVDKKLSDPYTNGMSSGYITGSNALMNLVSKKVYMSYFFTTIDCMSSVKDCSKTLYKEEANSKLSGVYEFDMDKSSVKKIHSLDSYQDNAGILTDITLYGYESSNIEVNEKRNSSITLK